MEPTEAPGAPGASAPTEAELLAAGALIQWYWAKHTGEEASHVRAVEVVDARDVKGEIREEMEAAAAWVQACRDAIDSAT
tara:strand:- start:3905 stop:4144 length:240 start_codon:yes stop_codon:yes gene_type:complete